VGQKLALHVVSGFKTAAGQHDTLSRRNRLTIADHARDLAVGLPTLATQEAVDRADIAHGDAPSSDVFVRDLEHVLVVDIALDADMRVRFFGIKSRNVIDFYVAPGVITGQGVIRLGRNDPCGGAERFGKRAHITRQFDSSVRQRKQDRISGSVGAGGFEIGERGIGILGDTRAAASANRNAPGMGFFLEHKHLGAGIMSRDGRDRSRKAETGHDNVVTFSHRALAFLQHWIVISALAGLTARYCRSQIGNFTHCLVLH
jgi:hypothetical protein